MRVAFIGASSIAIATARTLSQRGHDVVIVDRDREKLDQLARDLDGGFLHGDGTLPAVLRELDPGHTDVLLCLTGSDQANLIASLVGRSLGFGRVVTRIDGGDFEHIAIELGLEDTIVPSRTISRFLSDMVEGRNILELSAAIKGDTTFFVFVAGEEDAGPIEALALPAQARVTHFYRENELHVAEPDTRLAKGDEVVIVTHRKLAGALEERWGGPDQTK
jgi:trk system potassium uptake protein TrkA